jgi:transmembrane sensor
MKTKDFDRKILDNFKSGGYSRSEYKRVKTWFEQDDPKDLKQAMGSHWSELPSDQPLNDRLISLLDTLKRQIGFSRHPQGYSIFHFYQRIAAILFIPLVLGFGYWAFHSGQIQQQSFATIHSPEGARTEFSLPDGTTGWLNSGSVLTYPVEFAGNREVKIEGEAYFEVVRRQGEPFYVKTEELTVKVLGTSFNVSAYKDDKEASVILKEGKVRISRQDGKEGYVMSPNEKFIYDFNQKVARISQVDAAAQTAWTQGFLSFRGEPLSEVMKKLARWYNVDYEIRDKTLQNYSFKATFKDEQLDEILRMIALTTPMKYRIEERKLTDDGIYMKRKIIIDGS